MDGWSHRPTGWNLFGAEEYSENQSKLINNQDLNDFDDHDFIIVLAGGLDNLGRNHPWVKDRLDIAYELYKLKKRQILILGGGTYHKPPHLNHEKFVLHESTMGAKYLCDLGVNPRDLYREWSSYDTIANGYFSLLNFVVPMQLKKILVITSDFHMPRSRAIFEWIYGMYDQWSSKQIRIDFLEINTRFLDSEIMEARSKREMRSLNNLRQTMERIDTWSKFHDWFFHEHKAYNCQFNEDKKENIDDFTRNSY